MSVELQSETHARCDTDPCRPIRRIITPRSRDLGGFSVRRVLPVSTQRMVGPWIFFDHMGPVEFPAGQGIDIRPHPHINLATVTYLFEGEILHRDSLGSDQAIRPGDINLMVAGRGIVHSERERPEQRARDHRLHGLQLWLALPEEDEETEPAFHHYSASELPTVSVDGVGVRVMMGRAYGALSPVRTFAETLYAEAELRAGERLLLPDADEIAVYVADGALSVEDIGIGAHSMAVFRPNETATVRAREASRIAIIGGEALGERSIFWNFVSSRAERIEQAKADWREGRFPSIPGDDTEFIPLPE